MGAKHNLPSLENVVMDSPDVKKRDRGGGGGKGRRTSLGLGL